MQWNLSAVRVIQETGLAAVLSTILFVSCSNKGDSAVYCKIDESKPAADLSAYGGDAGLDGGASSDESVVPENDFTGLYCFEYHLLDGKQFQVNIINFWASCGGPFDARVTKGTSVSAQIDVFPLNCGAAGCMCPYDFTVDVNGLNLKSDIELTVGRTSCLTESVESKETATLPLSETSNGMVCQYMGTKTGGRHAPCVRPDDSCDTGLICAESETLFGVVPVCLVPCETEADCPIPANFTCDAGACHVQPGMTQTIS